MTTTHTTTNTPALLAMLSSVLLSFALRPWGIGALALVALVPTICALHQETNPWKAALWTYITMMGGTFVALEGLAYHLPYVFSIGVVIYSSVFALVGLVVHTLKPTLRHNAIWCFPIVWIAMEYLVGQRDLLGLWANPIMTIGYTQHDTPLLQTARLSGATGVSFLVVATNTAIAWAILTKRWQPLLATAAVALVAIYAPTPSTTPRGKPFKAGIAQGYFSDLEYTIADFDQKTRDNISNRYQTLLRTLEQHNTDIAILPESTFGGWYTNPESNTELRQALAATPLALVGAKIQNNNQTHNAILEHQREANRLRQVYAKQIPIPLTESGFTPGQNKGLVRLGGVLFGLAICWENVFPSISRETANAKAEVLVYQNSLLWAGRTATPVLQQHISAFRAVETGRDVIHATAGGPSAIIAANGSTIASAPQSTETTTEGMVQPRTGTTLYLMLGDWVGLMCAIATGALLTWRATRQKIG